MAPFADMEVEQDGDIEDENVLVSNLFDKEKETVHVRRGIQIS